MAKGGTSALLKRLRIRRQARYQQGSAGANLRGEPEYQHLLAGLTSAPAAGK